MSFCFWFISRFVVPLAAAAYLLLDRWGKENLIFYIVIPPFFLVLKMFMSQFERPECSKLEDNRVFTRTVSTWHACDLIGLLFLMLFEATIAGIAEEKALIALPYLFAFCGMFLPYTILTIGARISSHKAKSIIGDLHEIPEDIFTP